MRLPGETRTLDAVPPAEADPSLMAVPLGPMRKVDGRLLMASAAALGRTSLPAAAR